MVDTQAHKLFLEKIRNGLATKVRIFVPDHACPACQAAQGAYSLNDSRLDEEFALPLEGCSCLNGCQAMYAPILDMRGP